MRNIFSYFYSDERKMDPQTYADATDMLARVELANHRLAQVVTAHNDYLKFLSDQTERDHLIEFDVFFLNNRERYTDDAFNTFKH